MSTNTPYKCVLLGNARLYFFLFSSHSALLGAGKSSLLLRAAYDKFSREFDHTIGLDFGIKKLNVNNKEIKLHIWDTNRGQRFTGLPPVHYRGVAGVFLVYSITDRETFGSLSRWLQEARKYVDPCVPVIVVGTKMDKEKEREVSCEEGEEFAKENGFLFFETSAKSSENVEQVFVKMAELIQEKIESKAISYKCVLLGDKAVGKSNLIAQLFGFNTKNKCKGTSSNQFYNKDFNLNDKNITLQISDGAIQGGFRQSFSYYYRDLFGAILVYDITNRQSFVNVAKWLREAREKYDAQMPVILLGNKADMKSRRVVSYEEGEELAKENGMVFFETCWKSSVNVEQVFLKMVEMMNKKVEEEEVDRNNQKLGIKLQGKKQVYQPGSCFC